MRAETRVHAVDRGCAAAVRAYAGELKGTLRVNVDVRPDTAGEAVEFTARDGAEALIVEWSEVAAPAPAWDWEKDDEEETEAGVPAWGLARHYGRTLDRLGRNPAAARAYLESLGAGTPEAGRVEETKAKGGD